LAIGQDITIRKKAEKELSTSLSEKSILLSEIHHRVKNNLQIITSLINLQLADISNDIVQETLSSLQNRIQSMALVHEMLYSNESFSEIDFYDYLYQITATISATHNRIRNPIKVLVEGENLHLDIERSTTCGLIVNELILNAFKHAFNQEQTDCKIDITIIKKESGQIILKVEDNGRGISTSSKSGMGTFLIEALTDQLNGKMEIKENNGTSFILSFQN
ncbi:MAG: sensor histidine kinase, partial [Spirochaetales bacterium]|nr:sensor histidine kinase [Spirochaetales bacterium]